MKDIHCPPFPLGNHATPKPAAFIEEQLTQMNVLLKTHRAHSGVCVRAMYSELINLRGKHDEYPDRLVFGWDSAGDLVALYILADEAVDWGTNVHVIYYRTLYNDDAVLAQKFLEPLTKRGVKLDFFDYLEYSYTVRCESIALFASSHPTISITDLSDRYDLREDTNRAQQIADTHSPSYDPHIDLSLGINGLEVPQLSFQALASPMFTEGRLVMKERGNACIDCLSQFESLRFTSPDGTDLHIKVLNKRWINEAMIDFTLRPHNYMENPELLVTNPPVCDNPPGEIYTGIADANGTLVLYQIETDVVDFGYRHTELFGSDIIHYPRLQLTYNPSDPIRMEIQDGFIILESIEGNGIRPTILKEYLKTVQREDSLAITSGDKRLNNASLRISELGLGINSKANNPEEYVVGERIFSTLITEKCLGVWHIAFGKFPLADPLFNIRSLSHIDNGLRNQDLKVFGILPDGTEHLLTGSEGGQKTKLETILGERSPTSDLNS